MNYNVPATHLSFGTAADHYAGLDRFGRPITIAWLKGSTASVKAQYRYDRSSNRQWRRDAAAHAAGVTTEDQWYEYDGLYQVRGFQRGTMVGTYPDFSSLSPVAQNESWNYDAMGNWLGYTNDALSQTRQFNKVNEITSLAGPANAITPLYDPTGNMTTMPAVADWTKAQTLTWDAWNRLVKVSEGPTTIAEYSYDALFRRITKIIGTPGSTTTRRFHYNDQWQILEEYVASANNPEARYWYGLRDMNDIAHRQRHTTGTTLQDDLYALRETMNVVALVDSSGTFTQRMSYDAFGDTSFLSSAWASGANAADWAMLFHAHYRDTETGLYQMRSRYYQPILGIWLSRDPIGELEGGINGYLFCEGNPVEAYDPLGEVPLALSYVHLQTYSGWCGFFMVTGYFTLRGVYDGTAHLFQKVSVKVNVNDCPRGPKGLAKAFKDRLSQQFGGGSYFEAWPDQAGGSHLAEPHARDENGVVARLPDGSIDTIASAGCTKGKIVFKTKAVVYAGEIPDNHFPGLVPASGDLPSSPTAGTVGKRLSNLVRRTITATWNCCEGQSRTTVSIE